MTVMDAIRNRRSVRRYQPDAIPAEKLEQVLEAGRLAPSARNLQNWRFHVVRSSEKRAQMIAACNNQSFIGQAPVILVVVATENGLMSCGQPVGTVNASIALSYMTLAAEAAGLGTCWIGSFQADAVHRLLGLAENEIAVAITPLGMPAEEPNARPRAARDAIVVEH